MELLTLVPHLLFLKNYVLFKFQFGNIAAPQVENWSTYPFFPTPVLSNINILIIPFTHQLEVCKHSFIPNETGLLFMAQAQY